MTTKLNPDMVQDVLDFHLKFGQHVGAEPGYAPFEVMRLRFRLINEEWEELQLAFSAQGIPEIADATADLIYVLIGFMIAMGIDLRPIWTAVQRANMAKVGGAMRKDGKVLKPDGWVPPDIASILSIQPSLLGPRLVNSTKPETEEVKTDG
jgi:predicted HAD superfamily Cof-like phosphohydrolase